MKASKKEQLDALAATITDKELEYFLSRLGLTRAGCAEGRIAFRRWVERDEAARTAR